MAKKPTYEELEQRVKELEKEVAECKQAEEALQERGNRYRDLYENAPNAYFSISAVDGSILRCNSRAVELLGYEKEQLMRSKVFDLYADTPYGKSKAKETFRRFKAGERIRNVELQMKHKNANVVWISLSVEPVRDPEGNVFESRSMVVDISDRKRAEEALQESEEKYRNLFENANDAIFIADTKTNIILDANRRAEQLIGRPRKEIIGMHQSKLHPPQHAEYYKDKFRHHVRKGRVLDLEAEIIKKDGSIVPVFISASVIKLHGKEVIQGLFRDISGEKRILNLKEEIADRKLVDRAKGILMDRYKVSEKEAMRRLQKESRRQRKKIKEIAQAVISSEIILD